MLAQTLRREAAALIDGTKEDVQERARQARIREQLKKLDRDTYDYDLAVLLEPNEPRLLLARGRRYLELKRDAQAADDYVKTLDLRPGDLNLRRGLFHEELARRGDLRGKVLKLRPQDQGLQAIIRALETNRRDSGPAGVEVNGNLLKNASFEQGPDPGGATHLVYNAGATTLPGWEISRGSIDVVGTYFGARRGRAASTWTELGRGTFDKASPRSRAGATG